MNNTTYHLSINPKGITLNGVLQDDFKGFDDVKTGLTDIYRGMGIDYPKFHKMDSLCKLAFLGVELLKQKIDLSAYKDDEIALVFQNNYASLDTDVKHQEKISTEGQQASPAIFVYTLPNILLGEIAIRNKWFGENSFVLADQFDFSKWQMQVALLFETNKAKVVIGGWAEVFKERCELELYFIEKD